MKKFIAWIDMIKQSIMRQDGVISIMLLIILPIMILGSVYTHRLLSQHATENKAHKIAYACSEAYLSRNNKYLFDNFGIIATLDSDILEKSLHYYFEKNQLTKREQDMDVKVQFYALNNPSIFNEAALDAASTVVFSELLDYSIGLLDQLEIADRIRVINKSLQDGEIKLSEQMDQSGATEILNKLGSCEDVIKGKDDVTSLIKYLDEKHQTLYTNLGQLKNQINAIEAVGIPSGFSVEDFVKTKLKDWNATESNFLESYNRYSEIASDLMDQLEQIERDQFILNEISNELEVLKLEPVGAELALKIENLKIESNLYYKRITAGFDLIKQIIETSENPNTEVRPTILDWLKNIAYDIETLISGIDIGEDQLIVKDTFELMKSELNSEVDSGENSIRDKILLNEYYLAVFSSYDKKCPRKLSFGSRLNDKRIIKGEVEYLISGETIEKKSISNVRIKLFAIREAANLVTLISDTEKMQQITNVTIVLPQPWRTIANSAFIATWCSVESYVDVNRLMKGEGFYYFKSKTEWATDFDTLLSEGWRAGIKSSRDSNVGSEVVDLEAPEVASDEISTLKMFYLDYLRILLLMQTESETTNRAMMLIACELDDVSEGKSKLGDFSRGHLVELHCDFGATINSKKTELRFNNEY